MTTQLGMDPGQMTEEIEILELREHGDGQGGRGWAYESIVNGFRDARIRPLSARTRIIADQSSAPGQYEVTMRYEEGIRRDIHRIRWHNVGIDLEIVSDPLNLDERCDYLQFTAAKAAP